MNLDTPELRAFRQEVRDFFARELPEDIRRKVAEDRMDLPKDDQRRWHDILVKKGWAVPSWPVEWHWKQRRIWAPGSKTRYLTPVGLVWPGVRDVEFERVYWERPCSR